MKSAIFAVLTAAAAARDARRQQAKELAVAAQGLIQHTGTEAANHGIRLRAAL